MGVSMNDSMKRICLNEIKNLVTYSFVIKNSKKVEQMTMEDRVKAAEAPRFYVTHF